MGWTFRIVQVVWSEVDTAEIDVGGGSRVVGDVRGSAGLSETVIESEREAVT